MEVMDISVDLHIHVLHCCNTLLYNGNLPITGITPNVFFGPTMYSVNENDGTVTLTVQTDVAGGPQSGAVQFYTESGSATGTCGG